MASTSSAHSSSQSPKKYDVFISFRGEDTRFNFTSHVHDALRRNQLDTYIDYRLEKGDEVWASLERAIEDSTLFLVIISENYASSTWCLKELTKIFDSSKNQDRLVIPAFYRVDPSHVRKQSGSYQKAFEEHENKGINKHQMQIWREALTHAANLAGWDCSLDKNEAELVKEIMNCVVTKLGPRRSDDSLINAWILFRYLFIGLYVGCATVGIFIIWYTHGSFLGIDLTQDNHSLVTYSQLANWGQCSSWKNFTASPFTAGDKVISFGNSPCDYFKTGNVKATTLSLSVLVAMKKFNSLNALSEDGSLLTMPPWEIPWLLLAMSLSFGMHFLVFYVPFLAQTFGIVPLTLNEWLLVLVIACPVLLIDEELKFCGEVYKRVSNFQIEDESRVDN